MRRRVRERRRAGQVMRAAVRNRAEKAARAAVRNRRWRALIATASSFVVGVAAGAVLISEFSQDAGQKAVAATEATVPLLPAAGPVAVPVPDRRPSAASAFDPMPEHLPDLSSRPTEALQDPAAMSALPAEDPLWVNHGVALPLPVDRPMIAVVIDDLGPGKARVDRAISLPAPLTLAFLPYAGGLPEMTRRARGRGHELLVHMPMQPDDADEDPGPNALFGAQDFPDLQRRIEWNLARFDGYVGVNNHMGSRFTRDPSAMGAVLAELNRRGLMFLDSRTSGRSVGGTMAQALGMPFARRDVFLDADGPASDVAANLAEVERVARRQGFAVAIGHPFEVTLDTLATWLKDLEARGFALVPVSAIAKLTYGRRLDALAAIGPGAGNLEVTAQP